MSAKCLTAFANCLKTPIRAALPRCSRDQNQKSRSSRSTSRWIPASTAPDMTTQTCHRRARRRAKNPPGAGHGLRKGPGRTTSKTIEFFSSDFWVTRALKTPLTIILAHPDGMRSIKSHNPHQNSALKREVRRLRCGWIRVVEATVEEDQLRQLPCAIEAAGESHGIVEVKDTIGRVGGEQRTPVEKIAGSVE